MKSLQKEVANRKFVRRLLWVFVFAGILWLVFEDNRYIGGVSERQLLGVYATDGWEDTLKIFGDGKTERLQYQNGILVNRYEGSWHYVLQDRYSIGIDIYANDVLPEKDIFTGHVRITFGGSYTFYRL